MLERKRLSKKPLGYFKRKDKSGRVVTHPVMGEKPRPYQEPPMKVYRVETHTTISKKPKSIWEKIAEEEQKRRLEDERKLAELNLKKEQEREIREMRAR